MITGRGPFYVKAESGKNLGGPYKTRKAASKRLRQVEYFKRRSHGRSVIGGA